MDIKKNAFIQFSCTRHFLIVSELSNSISKWKLMQKLGAKLYVEVVWVSFEGSYDYVLAMFFHSGSDVPTPAVWALGILIGRNYSFVFFFQIF